MAYVPGFEHDVFVSYAVVDDEKEHGVETGWVTAFMKSLEAQLAKSIGRLGRLQPWWDRRSLAKNAPIDEQIQKALESTACMVVILSKGYLKSEWCRVEREIFTAAAKKQQRPDSRLFIVDQGSVNDDDRRKLFDNILSFEFFKRDIAAGKQLLGYPEPHPRQHPEYYSGVNCLAGQLKTEFDRLKASPTAMVVVSVDSAEVCGPLDTGRKSAQDASGNAANIGTVPTTTSGMADQPSGTLPEAQLRKKEPDTLPGNAIFSEFVQRMRRWFITLVPSRRRWLLGGIAICSIGRSVSMGPAACFTRLHHCGFLASTKCGT